MSIQDTQKISLESDKLGSSDAYLSVDISADSSLVNDAIKGDNQAFRRLFDRYRTGVYAICLNYSHGDEAQAHDLLQETFISAFYSLHQLRVESMFPYWLQRIARNKCVSFKRKQRTLNNVLRDYEVIKPQEDEREWSAADLQLVADIIESMEDSDVKETIRLFYLEGKHSGEIAGIQDISQTAVTTRLNRFRVKFRKRIIQDILKLRASRS